MKVLGIETSCDETAVSVVEEKKIISSVVASQIDIHSLYGGVVPELASREHLKKINIILDKCLKKGSLSFKDIDAVAVTFHPGLEGSLLVGLMVGRTISFLLDIPYIEVDHIEAHLFASVFTDLKSPPGVGLVVSGGHTRLIYIKKWGDYKILGNTRDDAVGESFDKVASLLKLSYPGGPAIEKVAENGDSSKYRFPVAKMGDTYDFSYSGLKTAVLYKLKYDLKVKGNLSKKIKRDIASSFQEAAFKPLLTNAIKAARRYGVQWIFVCGGVAANGRLRQLFYSATEKEDFKVVFPPPDLATDNASMVAACGEFYLNR